MPSVVPATSTAPPSAWVDEWVCILRFSFADASPIFRVTRNEWLHRMHFHCSTFGSAGDVFPMLGLALALRDRGHDILFATNAHFENLVRSQGLPFKPLGSEADYQDCIAPPKRSIPYLLRPSGSGRPHIRFLASTAK